MAVRIRLKRMGKVRTPFYRIVVCDSRTKRDGRVIEEIGTYNPKTDPSTIHIDSERALHWLGHGAQPSTPVAAILKLTGDWQKFKGEPGESTLRTVEPRRDKTEIFNEALKDAHGDAKSEAVTKKAARSERPATPEKKAATPEKPATPEKKPDAADESVERADKAHAEAASGEAADSASGSEAASSGAAASDQAGEPASDPSGEAGSGQVKSDEA